MSCLSPFLTLQPEIWATRVLGDGYLHGVVIDEAGMPVREAPVTLVVQRAYGIDCATLQCDLFNAPVYVPAARTDRDGRFTLRVPARFLDRPGLYVYKLECALDAARTRFFYGLRLAAGRSAHQTFVARPRYWER